MIELGFAGILSGALVVGGVVLLVIVVYIKHRASAGDRSPRQFGSQSEALEVRRNIRELMGQLDDHARRIDEQIELRLGELRRLLKDADARIAEIDHKVATNPQHHEIDNPVPNIPVSQEAASDNTTPESFAPSVPSAPFAPSSPSVPSALDIEDEINPQHREIILFHNNGLDPVEIARQIKMNVGEVELVLNLNRSRQKAKANP